MCPLKTSIRRLSFAVIVHRQRRCRACVVTQQAVAAWHPPGVAVRRAAAGGTCPADRCADIGSPVCVRTHALGGPAMILLLTDTQGHQHPACHHCQVRHGDQAAC
jgi:hypothetical protein